MALHAAPHPYRAPGSNLRRSGPSLTVIEGSRGRPDLVTLRATELADLVDELTALTDERAGLATEIEALGRRIVFAIGADRPDVALHVAGRLDALAASLTRRSAA